MSKLKGISFTVAILIILLSGIHCKKEPQEQIEVKILAPKDSAHINGTTEIVASAYGEYSDGQLSILIDSTTVSTSSAPYITYEWNIDTLQNGTTHTIQAKLSIKNDDIFSEEVHVSIFKDDIDLIWRKRIGRAFFSAVAIDNTGNIYAGSDDSYVYAIDSNGNTIWTFKTNGSIYSAPSIDSNNNIYFGSLDGTFYSLDQSGQVRWKYPTNGPIYTSGAISEDGRIYFGSADSTIYALDTNGNLIWKYKLDGEIFSTPVITSSGYIWIGTDNGTLYLISTSGNLILKKDINSPIIASLALDSHDNVYVGTYGGEIFSIDTAGNILWQTQLHGIIHASPVIGNDGTVYVISTEFSQKISSFLDVIKSGTKEAISYVYSFNSDGSEKWKAMLPTMVLSTPVITGEKKLIVGDGLGEILVFSQNGSLSQKLQLNSVIKAPVALTREGKIYVVTEEGTMLYLFNPNLIPTFEGWPMFGYNNYNNFRKGEAWK